MDAAKEAKRSALAENTEHKANSISRVDKTKVNDAWSVQKERKEGKQRRLEKKLLKKKWLASKNAESTGEPTRKRGLNEVDRDDDDDDWEDLAREEKLAKRVRTGKASQQEFDAEFGDSVS
jgi:ATP-dependent RNA helicase DDX55/SPB4